LPFVGEGVEGKGEDCFEFELWEVRVEVERRDSGEAKTRLLDDREGKGEVEDLREEVVEVFREREDVEEP